MPSQPSPCTVFISGEVTGRYQFDCGERCIVNPPVNCELRVPFGRVLLSLFLLLSLELFRIRFKPRSSGGALQFHVHTVWGCERRTGCQRSSLVMVKTDAHRAVYRAAASETAKHPVRLRTSPGGRACSRCLSQAGLAPGLGPDLLRKGVLQHCKPQESPRRSRVLQFRDLGDFQTCLEAQFASWICEGGNWWWLVCGPGPA